ncbi:hypothetical protein AAMO2058_000295300 [Amorphochlora amoebiformis]
MFRSKNTRRQLKKGIDSEDARRKRDEIAVSLRKSVRDEQVQKRRMRRTAGLENKENSSGFGNAQGIPLGKEALNELPRIVAGIKGGNSKHRYECCVAIRKILSVERSPPIQAVLNTGIASTLISLLRSPDEKTQFEACWALTNIASGTQDQTSAIVKMGAIREFIRLLDSPNAEVKEQGVWALGNVAGDSPAFRDLVLQNGAAAKVVGICNQSTLVSTLRNCAWTLSNFCRGKPQPDFRLVSPILPTLRKLLNHPDNEVLTDTCWALSYLSDDNTASNQKIEAVVSHGIVPKLVHYLHHQSASVKTPALRTIGNIVTGNDQQTWSVVRASALAPLKALLTHQKKSIRKEACWTLSNITAGNKDQIQLVIQSGCMPVLIEIMSKAEFDVRKEAAWAIANAISGGIDPQVEFLVQQGVIEPFARLFRAPDAKIILVAMDAMDKILEWGKRTAYRYNGTNKCAEFLEECGGLDDLEDCQRHTNEEIYDKAVKILKDYFETGEEDEEDTALQPNLAQGANQFSFGIGAGSTQTEFKF